MKELKKQVDQSEMGDDISTSRVGKGIQAAERN